MEFNRKMRKKWGEPKKNFGAPFGVAIGVVAPEMGQNGGIEKKFRSSFGASKGTEIFFRFP